MRERERWSSSRRHGPRKAKTMRWKRFSHATICDSDSVAKRANTMEVAAQNKDSVIVALLMSVDVVDNGELR